MVNVMDYPAAARARFNAAQKEVAPYVGWLTGGFISAERIYRQALIRLHVDISDLPGVDNGDDDTRFRDRFRQWKAARERQAEDEAVQEGVNSMRDFDRAYAAYELMFDEPFPFNEDGPDPTAADIYRSMLQQMGAEVPDEVRDDPRALEAMFRNCKANGVRPAPRELAADSAPSFLERFPGINPPRRI